MESMNGITISFFTLIITVIISYFIACVIKVMVVLLHKFSKPEAPVVETQSAVEVSSDESKIAAVIAIAKSQK